MKYMGSKNRIAKYILPIMLEYRKKDQWWVEPFVGGANIIDKVTGNRIGADNNKYLVALLQEIQKGWKPPVDVTKEIYHDCMYNKDNYFDCMVGWVGFCCSYNGRFFEGYAGKITTKNGKKRDYIQESLNNVLKQKDNINDVCFMHSDYKDLAIPENSLIYCDPPYKNTKK